MLVLMLYVSNEKIKLVRDFRIYICVGSCKIFGRAFMELDVVPANLAYRNYPISMKYDICTNFCCSS